MYMSVPLWYVSMGYGPCIYNMNTYAKSSVSQSRSAKGEGGVLLRERGGNAKKRN